MTMAKIHDTFDRLSEGTPWWFVLSARVLPIALLGQFLTAGLALFRDQDLWGLHEVLGLSLIAVVGVLASGSLLVARLRGFGWWAGLTGALFLMQVALSAGAEPQALAYHPMNGALLLAVSLILLAKVERRLAQPVPPESVDENLPS